MYLTKAQVRKSIRFLSLFQNGYGKKQKGEYKVHESKIIRVNELGTD